jgi:hypothetical protein
MEPVERSKSVTNLAHITAGALPVFQSVEITAGYMRALWAGERAPPKRVASSAHSYVRRRHIYEQTWWLLDSGPDVLKAVIAAAAIAVEAILR